MSDKVAERELSSYAFAHYGGDARLYNGIHDLETAVERLKAELAAERDRLKRIIESDRTKVCDGVNALKGVIASRRWLTEGRGPYAWDDDRYRQEFRDAADAIVKALGPLETLAGNLKDSPTTTDEVLAARKDLEGENGRLKAEVADLQTALAAAKEELTLLCDAGQAVIATLDRANQYEHIRLRLNRAAKEARG